MSEEHFYRVLAIDWRNSVEVVGSTMRLREAEELRDDLIAERPDYAAVMVEPYFDPKASGRE